ncbi:hypothetical protein [Ruegeria sp.]
MAPPHVWSGLYPHRTEDRVLHADLNAWLAARRTDPNNEAA